MNDIHRLQNYGLLTVICAALSLMFSFSEARAASPGIEYSNFAANLDAKMPALLAKYKVPGTVISYIQNGTVAWTRAYGLANVGTREPMRPNMVFEHGSDGKMLTAWAVMRLLEQGKIELDAPANKYLKRWQIQSPEFDANQVTIRRLLAHTAGLSIHGFLDYSPRRQTVPNLVESLESIHPLEGVVEMLESGRPSLGQVMLVQKPGQGFKYSGAGYAILELVIQDVTGEAFDDFIQREIAVPLGAPNLRWAWTPELTAMAPLPYSTEQFPHEYRQLSAHAIGSEIASVSDFARLLAAGVKGPNGEPAGRGVLKTETIQEMMRAQPETGGVYGLGYGVGSINRNRTVSHAGANPGWTAFFILDTVMREGFVIASNSSRGGPMHLAVLNEWLDAAYGPGARSNFQPEPALDPLGILVAALAILFGAAWVGSVGWFVLQVGSRHRAREMRTTWASWVPALFWLSVLLFFWYWLYVPLPLYLPVWFPDLWVSPPMHILMGIFALWVILSCVIAFFPKLPRGKNAPRREPSYEIRTGAAPPANA